MKAQSCRALVLLLAAACFRYEEQMRPLRPDECPPEPPSRSYSHHVDDADNPGVIRGRIRAAPLPRSASTVADSAMPPLSAVRVIVDQLHRTTESDSAGRYRIDSVAPGRYAVRILRVGYRARIDTVIVPPRNGVVWDFALEPQVLDGCPGFIGVVERRRVWHWPWQR